LSDSIRAALPLSDLSQIEPAGTIAMANYRNLFGKESNSDWCYFFEKADLARQSGNWQEIVSLGDQAFQAKMHPYEKFSSEMLPFIEAYGRLERWKDAVRFSEAAISDMPALQEPLCETWKRILQNTPTNPDQEEAMKRINKLLASVEYSRCALP
jgi:hypothetical protein